MDPGFNDRVGKVFASISSSTSSSSWSLTDAQLERRQWNRHRDDQHSRRDDDQTPLFSSFPDFFNCQTQSLDDLDIRSSIGLDSTLDNEEEEDAYDKMAEGREDYSDRLYMKDVTDHGPYLNSHNVLPRSVHDVNKDPRANHDAAKIRLKEDDEDVVQDSDEPMLNAAAATEASGTVTFKSILKRRSDDEVAKPAKRVRFDSSCKKVDHGEDSDLTRVPENGAGVPDYILNPSKYTKYTLGDGDDNGVNNNGSKSNSEAYLEFLEQSSRVSHVELPKAVVFIPRKKRGDAGCNSEEQVKQSSTPIEEQAKQSSTPIEEQTKQSSTPIRIAAHLAEICEVQDSHVDDDDNDNDVCSTKVRRLRQYRAKIDENND